MKMFSRVLKLLYPEVCECCGRSLVEGETVICLHCRASMPRVANDLFGFGPVHERLASSVALERTAAMMHYFRGSPYTDLIHRAKYQGRPEIVRRLARSFARELAPAGFFDGIDIIVPVPLHPLRLLTRGYNQSEEIARGLADITGIPVVRALKVDRIHTSQTRRNAYTRWLNATDAYRLRRPTPVTDQHILLVDDVITTGATMLACCTAIRATAPAARLSVLSLALTLKS